MKDIHYRIKIDDGDIKAEFYENGKSYPVVKVRGNLNQKRTRKQLRKAVKKYSKKIDDNAKELMMLAEELGQRNDKEKNKFESWLE